MIPSSSEPADDREWYEQREKYVTLVISSPARKRVIVAGPGTGKTHAFREMFGAGAGKNLTLTFIRSLIADLEVSLAGLSEVYTFHGFAKKQLYESTVPGVSRRVTYYPRLPWLYFSDLNYLEHEVTVDAVTAAFHNLDHSQAVVSDCLRSGTYYDAVGHDDSVFRVLEHYRGNEAGIPVFDQIVVDEYQDFNPLEIAFIDELARKSPILIVGDDDQALYSFKHASPRYIRERAGDPDFERFELPFSSRCTAAVVEAANLVVRRATEAGLLGDRIDKPYISFVPTKREDSDRYPMLLHAACSVERKNASYMSRYIAQQIAEIPQGDIDESREYREPTALVLGPGQFITQIFEELAQRFPGTEFRASENEEPSLLDGYKLLRADEASRLGWRIVSYVAPLGNQQEVVAHSILEGEEIAGLLPRDYVAEHLGAVGVLDRYLQGADLSDEDRLVLQRLGVTLDIATSSVEDEPLFAVRGEVEEDITIPKIVVTTLVGAKGLQASHVFIVGLNEGHFPKSNDRPTDSEVCRLLVGLTRTKKQCHLVSFDMFAGRWWEKSVFLSWLQALLRSVRVDSSYFDGR